MNLSKRLRMPIAALLIVPLVVCLLISGRAIAKTTKTARRAKTSQVVCTNVIVRGANGQQKNKTSCYRSHFFGHAVDRKTIRNEKLPLPSGEIKIVTIEEWQDGKNPNAIQTIQLFLRKSPDSRDAKTNTSVGAPEQDAQQPLNPISPIPLQNQENTPSNAPEQGPTPSVQEVVWTAPPPAQSEAQQDDSRSRSASELYRSIINDTKCLSTTKIVRNKKGKILKKIQTSRNCRSNPDANWWEASEAVDSARLDMSKAQFDPEALARLRHTFRYKLDDHHEHDIHPGLFVLLSMIWDKWHQHVVLVSGHRWKGHGQKGGSYHTLGSAMDIRVNGVSQKELHAFLTSVVDAGYSGIGIYPKSGFIHIDFRPTPSYRWVDYSGPGRASGKRSKPKVAALGGTSKKPLRRTT